MFPAISQPLGRRPCCRCRHAYRCIAPMMRSNNMRLEADIIQNVLEHQILYNPKHPDAKTRRHVDRVWDQVAEKMEMPVEELRRRWKNLKDCYLKYLRSKLPGPKSPLLKRYGTWPWAGHMAAIKPYINYTPRVRYDREPSPEHEPKKPRVMETLNTMTYSGMENRAAEYDDIDLLFLSHAKVVKKFSPERQALLKYRIATIIVEEELANIRGDPLQTNILGPHCSDTSDIVNFAKIELHSEAE